MSNVLSEEKKQQVIALGRLGWSLRRIERETGIRRETISAYLKEAGIDLRPPRGRQLPAKPASPADEVTSDPEPKPASVVEPVTPESGGSCPLGPAVLTTMRPESQPGRSPSASAGETVRIHQVLPDGLGVAASGQAHIDRVAIGFAGAGRGAAAGLRLWPHSG